MEEILDQPFNEKGKDEQWINRGIALIRILVSLYFSNRLIRFWTSYPNSTFDAWYIPLALFLAIVHTIYRIIPELKKRFIIPRENRILVLLMIIIYLIPTTLVFHYLFDKLNRNSLLDVRIENIDVFLLPLGLSIIIFREIIYFIRLKQLKNQANE